VKPSKAKSNGVTGKEVDAALDSIEFWQRGQSPRSGPYLALKDAFWAHAGPPALKCT